MIRPNGNVSQPVPNGISQKNGISPKLSSRFGVDDCRRWRGSMDGMNRTDASLSRYYADLVLA
jgi:hypothetical protein